MSNDRAPNIPGHSNNPITVGGEDEEVGLPYVSQPDDEDVVEIGEFVAGRDDDQGLAGQLRHIAYERAQDIGKAK